MQDADLPEARDLLAQLFGDALPGVAHAWWRSLPSDDRDELRRLTREALAFAATLAPQAEPDSRSVLVEQGRFIDYREYLVNHELRYTYAYKDPNPGYGFFLINEPLRSIPADVAERIGRGHRQRQI